MLTHHKATTQTRRHQVRVKHVDLTTDTPEKSLLKKLNPRLARSGRGKITVRGRGTRADRMYRLIDFRRLDRDLPGTVKTVEYDPYRSCYISLVFYPNGKKSYILNPNGVKVGDQVLSAETTPVLVGNAMRLANIPSGTAVHNIIIDENRDGGLVRSAGTSAVVMGQKENYTQIKLPSGEVRLVLSKNYATIGQLSNLDNMNQKFGKAGTLRHKGFRPIVRGVAQHPRSHPHGGGQGKAGRHGTGGPAVDPWGNKRFAKTRNNKRTQKFILRGRNSKKALV
ncbi:50S ribosomal protein L2 [bacterium]|nr:MAG: 50S ribosomal protein L2 [bacterium]